MSKQRLLILTGEAPCLRRFRHHGAVEAINKRRFDTCFLARCLLVYCLDLLVRLRKGTYRIIHLHILILLHYNIR